MLGLIKEHNQIPRKGLYPVVQYSSDYTKVQLHNVDLIGKKSNNDDVSISLSINAYVLSYGPCIAYNILSNIPFKKDEWKDHPFKDIKMDYDSYNIALGDYIDNTPTTRMLLEDIIIPDKWKKYIKPGIEYTKDQVKSELINKVINIIGMQDDYSFDTKRVPMKLKVNVLELENNQLAIKISVNQVIKDDDMWSLHPFRYLKKNLKSISGIVNDTPLIRQMIDDITIEKKWELYTTYDLDYRSHVINNIKELFVKPNDMEKTKSQVINTLIKCLKYHWS